VLEAAASAIAMIEAETITAAGRDGSLFLIERTLAASDGRPPRAGAVRARRSQMAADYWRAAVESLNEVVALARNDPPTTSQLYRILCHAQVGPDGARRLLADVGITRFDLSQIPESGRSQNIE